MLSPTPAATYSTRQTCSLGLMRSAVDDDLGHVGIGVFRSLLVTQHYHPTNSTAACPVLHWELHHDVELARTLHDAVTNRHPIGPLPLLTYKGRSPLVPVSVLLAVVDRLLLSSHSFFDVDLLVLEDHVLDRGEPFRLLQLTIALQVLFSIAPHDDVLDAQLIQVLVK